MQGPLDRELPRHKGGFPLGLQGLVGHEPGGYLLEICLLF